MAMTASTMLKALTFGLIITLVVCADQSTHKTQPTTEDRYKFGMGVAIPFGFSGVIPNQGYGGYPGVQPGFGGAFGGGYLGYPGGFPFPNGYSPYPFPGGYGQYPGGFGGYPYGGMGGYPNGPMAYGSGATYLSNRPSHERAPNGR